MRLAIELNDPKGRHVIALSKEFKELTCMSDADQQLPKKVFQYQDKLYGYHRASGRTYTFREREVICV